MANIPPGQVGELKFDWILNAPNPKKIPKIDDLLGASAMMISASFKNNEFFRCSYFVYNNILDEKMIVDD